MKCVMVECSGSMNEVVWLLGEWSGQNIEFHEENSLEVYIFSFHHKQYHTVETLYDMIDGGPLNVIVL